MKKLFLTVMAICSAAGLTFAASKEASPAKSSNGEPFDMTGTVIKYQAKICMEGNIHYGIRSVDRHAWLSVSTADEAKLKTAFENKGWVNVKGTWWQGA